MNIDIDNLVHSLEIMGVGMLGLFTVMILIAIVVVVLNNLDKRNSNN